MADVTSNLGEIDALLDQLATSIDFTSPGIDRGVGEDLVKLVALGERDRAIVNQQAPDGSRWPDNAPAYARRKAGRPVGVGLDREGHPKGGDMLSEVQLTGEVTITADEITMDYGVDEAARRKIQWFTNGSAVVHGGEPSGARNQPARPVIGLDDAIQAEVDEYIGKALDDFLGSL